MKTESNIPHSWDVTALLAESDVICERVKEVVSPRGSQHIFISSMSSLTGQALYVGRRLDQKLYLYHLSQHAPKDPGELWLHGIGALAIERTIELALHLQHHMYPGLLETEVQTGTCSTALQLISSAELDGTTLTERDRSKSAVHIKLRLLPTRSSV